MNDLKTDSMTDLMADPLADRITYLLTNPVSDTTTDPMIDPIIDPKTSRACLAERFSAKNGDPPEAGKFWENRFFTGKMDH